LQTYYDLKNAPTGGGVFYAIKSARSGRLRLNQSPTNYLRGSTSSWTELGAHQIGVMQSLLVTCKLHDIDPYGYLVDVLQRISEHPNSKIEELTPRRWKELFASNPMRSALHQTLAN
jgi:IS66 C-terminal element